jgi:hypothetical protein
MSALPPKSDILHRATMTSGGMINGLRFIAMRWDDSLPPAEAAKRAGTPAAWQQLGRQAIMPERMR